LTVSAGYLPSFVVLLRHYLGRGSSTMRPAFNIRRAIKKR
jgi:hypothetical protein